MPTTERSRPNVLLTLACVVVVVAGLKAAGTVLVPFLLSILIAVISMPIVRWLQGLRVPAGVAVGLTVAMLVGLFTGFVYGFLNGLLFQALQSMLLQHQHLHLTTRVQFHYEA